MGGLIIISSLIISTLLWSDFQNPYIWILIFITVSFSTIGFLDDWLKIKEKNSKGLNGKYKLILQFIFSLIAMLFMLQVSPSGSEQIFILPFNILKGKIKICSLPLGETCNINNIAISEKINCNMSLYFPFSPFEFFSLIFNQSSRKPIVLKETVIKIRIQIYGF